MAASAMQRSISKMIVREDEVEQRAALEEEKARRERAKKLRCEASRKRYLRAEEEHAHVGERQGPGQAPHGAARGAGQQRQQRQRVAAAAAPQPQRGARRGRRGAAQRAPTLHHPSRLIKQLHPRLS